MGWVGCEPACGAAHGRPQARGGRVVGACRPPHHGRRRALHIGPRRAQGTYDQGYHITLMIKGITLIIIGITLMINGITRPPHHGRRRALHIGPHRAQ
eukprot:6811856-Pyramimonas_sp.AAC.1